MQIDAASYLSASSASESGPIFYIFIFLSFYRFWRRPQSLCQVPWGVVTDKPNIILVF
jgi:hypothetical protein